MFSYEPEHNRSLSINNIPRFIVCAANIDNDGKMHIGVRHACGLMRQSLNGQKIPHTQGFIDQWGNFITREDALFIATENGQYINQERNGSRTELFSEGLYSIKPTEKL